MENYAPNAVTLSTPADSSETYDTTPEFTWSLDTPEDNDGDNVYYAVYVYDGESNLDFNSGFKDGNTSATATALDLDTYTWKVVAYDTDGTYFYDTNDSATRTLTIIENTVPNKPTITTIGGQNTNATIYDEDTGDNGFQITLAGYNSSDYDGDNQTFKWEIDNNSNFGSVTVTITDIDAPADINRSMTTEIPRNVEYYFRLGAIDPLGANDYNYSATIFKMTIANRVPTKPVVTAPSGYIYDTTPSITWTASTDGDGDDFNYCVVIKDSAENVDVNTTFLSSVASGYNATALDLDSYTVTIYVYDGYDVNNSDAGNFEVIENTVPNRPTITSVAGANTNTTVYDQDTGAPTFLWYLKGYNSSDFDGDAQSFKWEVDNNSNFGSPEYSADGLGVADINRSMTDALTKKVDYYVRLGAKDPLGANDYNYSTVLKLYLDNKAPTAGTLSSPADASETYDTTPTFEWTAGSDDDGDTVTKQVKVYDASGNLDYNNTFGSNTSATPGSALDLGTYTWRVRYYDGYDYTNSSDYTVTIIENREPNRPTITLIGGSDTNGSTIYDQDATGSFLIYLKGYNSSDPDGDDQSFGWLIDDDSAFGSTAYDTRWFADHNNVNASMTTAIPKKTWYYFRLDAKDPLGDDEVNSSLIRKHYLGNYVPTKPVVTAPTTTTSDTTPAITWTNSSDTDGDTIQYKVEISNASGVVRQSAYGVSQPYTNSTALSLGEYNITIYAYDSYDTNTSAVELFEVIATSPPSIPTLTYPENWSIRVLGTTHLNWTDSTDPESDPFTYTLYIESQAMTGQYIVKSGLTTSDYNAGDLDLLECHTYKWKVKSVQTDDNSTLGYTDWSYFQVDCTDIYEIKIISTYNEDSDAIDVAMWLEKNGQIMTDVSSASIVMKDNANTTVTTMNTGTVYSDGIYRDSYSVTGTEAGLYTLKGTLTYDEIVYYGVGVFDANIEAIQNKLDSGTGADQYEFRMEGAYDKTSGRVEVTAWIQKNGQMQTGISGVSIVMKDESNTTVHTFNSGTVYTDGFYKEVWTATGLHGIYSLKGTVTYSGNTYYGGSHFDAGIMEIFDALDSMEVTINLIDDYVDTLETNVNATSTNVSTILGYVGTPADTSASNTLFGYGQYLKDKWGTQTADTIYNKVVDVYTIVNASNASVSDIQSTLDDLDTYIRTYQGVEINVGSSYSFVDDQLEVTVAYVKDGTIQNTTSCTTLIKDTDGTTLKTFTGADDADNIYRYEWNSSAVDFPTNGFYGGYTIIPSVVYSGNTFSTVRTFSAEMPDLYGTTTYSSATTTYVDSGYSVALTSAYTGSIIYVKLDSSDATLDLTNVTVTAWWEDSTSTVLATTSTTGTVSSGILRFSATIPSGANGATQLRVSAEKTVYGHRTTTLSGLATGLTITSSPVGTGLPPSITKLEIRNCPANAKAGDTIDITVLATKSRHYNTGMFTIVLKDKYESYTQTNYELKFATDTQDAVVKFKVPFGMEVGEYELVAMVNNQIKDSTEFEVVKRKGLFDGLFENGFEIRIPDTDIVIRLK